MRAPGQVAWISSRRRARYARAFIRLPQMAMVHHVPERFLDWSKKSQRQVSLRQDFIRDQEPSAMEVTSVERTPAR